MYPYTFSSTLIFLGDVHKTDILLHGDIPENDRPFANTCILVQDIPINDTGDIPKKMYTPRI